MLSGTFNRRQARLGWHWLCQCFLQSKFRGWHHCLLSSQCQTLSHKFVVLLAYNMAQITISYALDFYCLVRIDRGSLSGIDPELAGAELMFECFYFSVLNFSFFGYGDITPAHVPAKIIMLLEVVTAFSTVIFLLSDFVSMKESMRNGKR